MTKSCLNDVWKELNGVEITHSIMHYLFAIDVLHKKNGYARGTDIAQELKVTPGSCSVALKNLIKKGLIQEDSNRFVFLSTEGKQIVEKGVYKRDILLNFFEKHLKLDKEIAQTNACKIEHLLGDEVIEAISKMK